MSVGQVDPRHQALSRVGELIQDETFRRSFSSDPQGTLSSSGVNAEDLPSGLVETLSELSSEEFDLVGRIQSKLSEPMEGMKGKFEIACLF